MIKKIKKSVPLYEEFNVFMEGKKKKRKPRVITVRGDSRAHNYLDDIEPTESIDINDMDDEFDDIGIDDNDYSAFDDISDEFDDVNDMVDDINNDEQSSAGTTGGTDDANPPSSELASDDPIEDDNTNTNDINTTGDQTNNGETPTTTDNNQDAPETGAPPATDTDTPPTTDNGGQNTSGTTGADIQGDTAGTDTTNPPPNDQTQTDTNPPPEATDAPPATNAGDTNSDAPPTTDTIDVNSNTTNDIGMGDDDFSADVDSTDNGNGLDNPAPDTGGTGQSTSPDDPNQVTKDDMKKFELYKRFITIHDTITKFIESLETIVPDDHAASTSMKVAMRKLYALQELTKDYMILKFKVDSYLQNAFFFEKIKATMLLILEMIDNNVKKPKLNRKKKNK